jgi:uncharacterized membrane protein
MAQGGRFNDWHMGAGMMGNWGMGGFGGIFMMFFWVLIIVGLILFIRWLFRQRVARNLQAIPALMRLKF